MKIQCQKCGNEVEIQNSQQRGFCSYCGTELELAKPVVEETVLSVNNLLERVFIFLEDGNWSKADEYCEKILDREPHNAQAYLCKLLSYLHLHKKEELFSCDVSFEDNPNVRRFLQYADEEQRNDMQDCFEVVRENVETKRKVTVYTSAKADVANAENEKNYQLKSKQYILAAEKMESVSEYEDASQLAFQYRNMAEVIRKSGTYQQAFSLETQGTVQSLEQAITLYEQILQWRDSADRMLVCQGRIDSLQQQKEQKRKKRKRTTIIIAVVMAVVLTASAVIGFLLRKKVTPSQIKQRIGIATFHLAYVTDEGTVETVEFGDWRDFGQCDVEDWTDIVAIAVADTHTIGMKEDGTVVATTIKNSPDYGQCDVDDWSDIVAIDTAGYFTYGVKKDGTVVLTEPPKSVKESGMYQAYAVLKDNVEEWTDIVSIEAESECVYGVKKDGTVVYVDQNHKFETEVLDWTDIVEVEVCGRGTILSAYVYGVKRDGTVVFSQDEDGDEELVGDFKGIVDCIHGPTPGFFLKRNGTLVWWYYGATDEQLDQLVETMQMDQWDDLIALQRGEGGIVGIKKDGTVEIYLTLQSVPENVTSDNYLTYINNLTEKIEDTVKVKVTK